MRSVIDKGRKINIFVIVIITNILSMKGSIPC